MSEYTANSVGIIDIAPFLAGDYIMGKFAKQRAGAG